MKRISTFATAIAMSLALAACGGKGDDKLGGEAQEAAENKADKMDAMAENMSGPAEDLMQAKADATREAGDDREEAIDESDVNAHALSPADRAKIVNGN
jgi:predicted small lipoprotein YifL